LLIKNDYKIKDGILYKTKHQFTNN
jgi:hypothetical protein